MGGCFPCFGSSNKEGSNGVGELSKKDSTKDASVGQSHHVNGVNSDFGLEKLGPVGDNTHVSTRVMGTYGYCAPEYSMTGHLTLKSDVYSFGVVFLELITGRKAIDNMRAPGEQNLVAWLARPLFKDRRKFPKMADPSLQGRYPIRGLYQALAVAAMCLQDQAATRPLIGDVVTALTYLATQTFDPNSSSNQNNRGGPSTPRLKDGMESPDNRVLGSPSTHRNSPSYRKRNHGRGLSTGAEISRNEAGGGSGKKMGLDDLEQQESHRDSPLNGVRAKETPLIMILVENVLLQRLKYGVRIGGRKNGRTQWVALMVRMTDVAKKH